MELCPGSLDERGVWGRTDPCICMVEFLQCSPEIITSLLIGYIPIQNKKLKKLKKRKKDRAGLQSESYCSIQNKSILLGAILSCGSGGCGAGQAGGDLKMKRKKRKVSSVKLRYL